MSAASFPRAGRVALLGTALLVAALGGCNDRDRRAEGDDLKRSLDQLVQTSRDELATAKDTNGATKSAVDTLRQLAARLDGMEKALTAAASPKRAAFYLPMEAETVCDNDAACEATARAVCNKVGYPKAIASRYTPGTRATLQSAVCFD